MGFAASAVRFTGKTKLPVSKSVRGSDAVRNFCAVCSSLVFGGIVGRDTEHAIYAGSLDNPSHFRPTIAIMNRSRPDWVPLPPGLTVFESMPG
jgi:hypothetical protein